MRLRALSAGAVCAFSLAACSTEDAAVPAGCREGPAAVREALRSAPDEVRVQGARLSECLVSTIDGGDLGTVGLAYLETAVSLAEAADRKPEGPAALQLGYLIGAMRGQARESQGAGAELERRIEQETGTLERDSRAFRRGLRAGLRDGEAAP